MKPCLPKLQDEDTLTGGIRLKLREDSKDINGVLHHRDLLYFCELIQVALISKYWNHPQQANLGSRK